MHSDAPRPSFLFSRYLIVALLFIHPLLRAGWDVWAQFFVYIFLCLIFIARWMENNRQINITSPVVILDPIYIPWGVFVTGALLSTIFSSFPQSADRALVVDASSFLFFFFGFTADRSEQHLYLKAVLGGALAACLWAFLAVISGGQEALFHSGPLVNTNVLAAYILLAFPLVFVFLRRERPAESLAWACVALIFVAALFVAHAVFAIGILFLLLTLMVVMRSPRLLRVVVVAIPVVFVGWLLFLGGKEKIFRDWDRLVWWKTSLQMWLENPVFGIGPGAFGEAYPKYRATLWDQNTLYAHNWFLELIAERGILGAGAFLWFLFLGARKARLAQDSMDKTIVVSLGAFLVYNFIQFGLSFPSPVWVFWFLGGILFTVPETERSRSFKRKSTVAAGFGLCAVILIVGAWSFRLFRADQCLAQARYAVSQGERVLAHNRVLTGLWWNKREPELYALRARLLYDENKIAEADENIQRAIALSSANAPFHLLAGDVKRKLGQTSDALSNYEQAGRLLPMNLNPWIREAEIFEEQNRWGEALSAYERAQLSLRKRAAWKRETPENDMIEDLEMRSEHLRRKIASAQR